MSLTSFPLMPKIFHQRFVHTVGDRAFLVAGAKFWEKLPGNDWLSLPAQISFILKLLRNIS